MKNQIDIIGEVARLHALGFAIHWVRPKSKAPVNAKWTSGQRATFEELKKTFRPEYNVGVRLGSASVVQKKYLAVIDFDLKSEQEEHQVEMLEKVESLFPGLLTQAPIVCSGRANGSGHIYVVTSAPCTPQRLAQSKVTVKVHMPSVAASKRDSAVLTSEEIAAGYRMRPAWEISQMGEGQQVVLPPSVHPDSGKRYEWGTPIGPSTQLPAIEPQGGPAKEKTATRVIKDFKPVKVDLAAHGVSERIVEILETAEDAETGKTDKSDLLYKVAIDLIQRGLSDLEILSVLTDSERFGLSHVGFDHTGSGSRARAAAWVQKYTIDKARKEHDLAKDFDNVTEISEIEEETISEAQELAERNGWKAGLERNRQAQLKNSLQNLIVILENDPGEVLFRRNLFKNQTEYGTAAPWGGTRGEALKEIDFTNCKQWLAEHYGLEPTTDKLIEAVTFIAHKNSFHEVRDYFRSLPPWDGKPRLDTWLKTYMSAEAPEPYLSAVSRKILVAAVKRIYEPGCKFDTVLILEGNQGVGKSTSIRNLFGDGWFSDAPLNLQDKDSVMSLQGIWGYEIGELSGLRKAESDASKAFMSRQVDKIRVPYGRLTENFPRQVVFIGTTNKREYLNDPTGNRRYWPVWVGLCRFEAIKKDRDQLWAEALIAYDQGETTYLQGDEVAVAVQEQEARSLHDTWTDKLEEFFTNPPDGFNTGGFRMTDLFDVTGPFAEMKNQSRADQMRVGDALRKLGYERKVVREGSAIVRKWARK